MKIEQAAAADRANREVSLGAITPQPGRLTACDKHDPHSALLKFRFAPLHGGPDSLSPRSHLR